MSSSASDALMVPSKSGKWRMCSTSSSVFTVAPASAEASAPEGGSLGLGVRLNSLAKKP